MEEEISLRIVFQTYFSIMIVILPSQHMKLRILGLIWMYHYIYSFIPLVCLAIQQMLLMSNNLNTNLKQFFIIDTKVKTHIP